MNSGERQLVPQTDAVMLTEYLASRALTVTETLTAVASGSNDAAKDRLYEKTRQVDALLQQLKQAGDRNRP
ncbi:uncharacterized protein ColSpa_07315 [Colletotrichum spaethianum]|uniref:Uncharacterized protein n=1 Tax=Colletotrichum spaethianum TaxID=700344 RepID=A0AA37P838_9PEZI|nr:uncharacterized protein ColSpa_07315 [Colletotrichum spaethianum]GKT47134.1 hypothetical protein ColSpa_07315 [Colletotrichum spaethianum]